MAGGAGTIERPQHRRGEDLHFKIEPGLRRMRRNVVFLPPPGKDEGLMMPGESVPVPRPGKATNVTPIFATKH